MASARGTNANAERLTADECDRRALAALEKAGHRGLTAADVGFRIWPDRRFDRRGAGGAASRVLRRLEAAGKAYPTWGTYNASWHAVAKSDAPDSGGKSRKS